MNAVMFDRLALYLPGLWIDHANRDFAWTAQYLLDFAVNQYQEALIACSLFIPLIAQHVPGKPIATSVQYGAYESHLCFLYAKAYVYGLDAARAFLAILAGQSGISPQTSIACDEFKQKFKHIRDIRNSLQHIEERAQGIGSHGKILQGTILNLGSLNDNRFGITSSEGRYVEIEVSERFLACVRSSLERVIWSFKWLGPGEIPINPPEV